MSGLFARLKGAAPAEWRAYTEHAFVRKLGDGTLPEASFRHYLVQDYLFLIQFARAWGLAAFKADKLVDIRDALAALRAIVDTEMDWVEDKLQQGFAFRNPNEKGRCGCGASVHV